MRTRKAAIPAADSTADSALRGYIFKAFVAKPWGPTKKTQMMNEWFFENLAEQSKPRDLIEWLKVKEMADNRTERTFFQNLKPGLIQKPRKQCYVEQSKELLDACEAAIARLRQKNDCKLQSKLDQLEGAAYHIDAETKRLFEAETERLRAEAEHEFQIERGKIIDETNENIRQVKHVVENDATDTDSFDKWIGPYERVSDRIAALDKEFEKLLEDFDRYRHGGLGERLRKTADEIIEGEYEDEAEYGEELDAPAVESTEATLAPAASGDATRAVDTSTTGSSRLKGR